MLRHIETFQIVNYIFKMNYLERIKKILIQKNLTKKKLAEMCNISESYMNKLLNGKNRMDVEVLLKISKVLRVPVYNFFFDEPLVPQSYAEREPVIRYVFGEEKIRSEFEKYRTIDDFIAIRILEDEASLGPGSEVNIGATKGYALIYKYVIPRSAWTQKRKNERVISLFAKGDSMTPTINDGSLIAVDLQDTKPVEGKIYCFWLEKTDEITIKRLIRIEDNFLIIHADNPNEPGYPKVLDLRKYRDINPIRGRVIWVWNKL